MFTSKSIAAMAASAVCLSFSSLALADDDERGHGRRDKREFKEEFWDGPCKVERELKKNGDYKEERKCQGGADHFPERKAEFREGPCKVEREWKKNGDFKEERKCEGRPPRHREAAAVPAAPVVAYPPWIMVEGPAPVYRPGHEPRPVQDMPSTFHCNSDTVGRILGGIVGAAVGNQIGSGSGRAIATAGGAIAGVLIGGEIGRRIDAGDQACIGQALEVAPAGHRVTWTGEGSQQYAVVPGKTMRQADGRYCRNYVAEVRTSSGWQKQPAVACRGADGVWVAARK
jgi:surface antigen